MAYHKIDKLEDSKCFNKLVILNNALALSLVDTWHEAERLLRTIPAVHPSMTSHGPDHALQLVAILDEALQPLSLDLSDNELYILLSAALLHDIGMAGAVDSCAEEKISIRNSHHLRSKFYIINKYKDLRIKEEYVRSIAEVASAHRKLDISKDIKDHPVGISSGLPPRAQLCAALLRLADECHITADRVPSDYGLLSLPQDNIIYYEAHDCTKSIHFDADAGNITFGGKIDNENIDAFIKNELIKIQGELDGIQEILTEYRIKYKHIKSDYDRAELVKSKIVKSLLSKTDIPIDDLLQYCDETKEEIEHFIREQGNCEPFGIGKNSAGKRTIYLIHSEKIFYMIKDMIFDPSVKKEFRFTFMYSDLAKRIIDDTFLNKLLVDHISSSDDITLCKRVIRLSPSALNYILSAQAKAPPRSLAGSTGLSYALFGELQNDFQQYPEILLEPGLLDDIFEDGKKDKKKWEEWRLMQGLQYHKAFEKRAIVKQWAVPQDIEMRADQLSESTPHKTLKANIAFKNSELAEDPLEIVASASRLRLPMTFRESGQIGISIEIDGVPVKEKSDEKIKLEFYPAPGTGNIDIVSPAEISFCEKDMLTIDLLYEKDKTIENWVAPISIRISANKEPGGIKSSMGISLNLDIMDCKQAACMALASGHDDCKVIIQSKGQKLLEKELNIPEAFKGKLFDALIKLSKIQDFLNIQIPYPIAGISNNTYEIILSGKIDSEDNAMALYEKVKKSIEIHDITCIAVERLNKHSIIDRRYLTLISGKMKGQRKIKNNNEDIRKIEFDPHKDNIEYNAVLSISSESAMLLLSEIVNDSSKNINEIIESIMKYSAKNICEAKCALNVKILKEIDRTWYTNYPVIFRLREIGEDERWREEAKYHLEIKGDKKRAYFAAKEALRINQISDLEKINFGWYALKAGRFQEAIKVTNSIHFGLDPSADYYAASNLGICNLLRKHEGPGGYKENIRIARCNIKAALIALCKIAKDRQMDFIRMSINDIKMNVEIDSEVLEIMKQLESIIKEEITVQQAIENMGEPTESNPERRNS